MSRAEVEAASCQGKFRHRTYNQAFRSMRHGGIKPYRCQFCGFWHVESENRPPKVKGRHRASNGLYGAS